MATSDYISIKQLASELGMDKSHARRYILNLGIQPHKRRTPESQNQKTLAVFTDEAEIIVNRRREEGFIKFNKAISSEIGFFYVIQLIPELDSKRIKLGFADSLDQRLNAHRTAAPIVQLLKSWPCRRTWEATVIDYLTSIECRSILNEVFECDNIYALVDRGDTLFSLLPEPSIRISRAGILLKERK